MASKGGSDNGVVVIVGAGLCGAILALRLGQMKYNVQIYERKEDWRIDDSAAHVAGEDQSLSATKRSINLALSHRGQEMLKAVGLLDQVMETAIPMRCRAVHSKGAKGSESSDPDAFVAYDNNNPNNFINSVSRGNLNNILLDAAERLPNVKIIFNSKVKKIDKDNTVWFETTSVKANVVFGCDGAYSGTRDAMLRLLKCGSRFERRYEAHGYKELTIPPTKDGGFSLSMHEALHLWPRGKFMMIGLPNFDGSFTCTLFAPFHTEKDPHTGKVIPGMMDVKTDEEIKKYFENYFPDLVPVMPDYIKDFKTNPASQLVSILVRPWNYEDKIVLLGDAAHATVPFYGQGMNCAFEDVLVFTEMLAKNHHDLSLAVPEFAKTRQPDGEAIGTLSMRNYQTMSDHSGSAMFRVRKRFEGLLSWLLPDYWVPEYKMVAFTRIPYSDVVDRSNAQDWALTHGVFYYAAAALAIGATYHHFFQQK